MNDRPLLVQDRVGAGRLADRVVRLLRKFDAADPHQRKAFLVGLPLDVRAAFIASFQKFKAVTP